MGQISYRGALRGALPFWKEVVLLDNPQAPEILGWLRDGVRIQDYLLPYARGLSAGIPYDEGVFDPLVFPNHVKPSDMDLVGAEVRKLVQRGCLVPWDQVKAAHVGSKPRRCHGLGVEPSKGRVIYDMRPLNEHCRQVPF